jgi:acetylornithine deacetylase/succinyl-diaminopimelate desuccinylase-like protein
VADFAALDAYVAAAEARWLDELIAFCRFPSEQDDLDALRGAADWIGERLRAAGAEVDVIELPQVAPLVVGEIGRGPRTLTLVQHYDVQPAVPLELWTSPAYEPTVREGRLYARGATDNKGELLPRLWAAEAWLATIGELPVRLRFLVEGEEESGSRHLGALLDQRPELRAADGALIEGGSLDLEGHPEIAGGGRGMVAVELVARTIGHDAHSSAAMVLPNAGVRLVQALATLWDAEGLPALEGIDAGIRPPSPAQLALVDAAPLRLLQDVRDEFGIERFIGGREGIAALRAMTFEPTLNLQGLWSGYTGPGVKTIVPAEAHARLDIRLVPDQIPDTIETALRGHLDRHGFSDVEIVRIGSQYRAWWTPAEHPILDLARVASEEVTGTDAIQLVAFPGTVPMWEVCGRDRVPATTLGAARDDCRAHAPDENIRLEDLATATRISARFYGAFATAPAMPPVAD